ncbi:hypothetical protein IMZ48_39805 [Candidatus Bathyarchaeota archaeon]|nr:hypothetical protein [Candidatus Bathyarchaeota archaeon]
MLHLQVERRFREAKLTGCSRFYQYYCTNGQTYLKEPLDNGRYPNVEPVTFRTFMQSHALAELGDASQNAGAL